ncbi:MAG: sulfurtransferase TusA family protein [Euryarchaeota archaeon]|nr:sulfurtransferase TusA family protein [Euryarchaeota archaeon]
MTETAVQPHKKLDLSGEVCPWPVIFTQKEVKKMAPGEVLEVLTDNLPSVTNIPDALAKEGHQVLATGEASPGVYRILIRKK